VFAWAAEALASPANRAYPHKRDIRPHCAWLDVRLRFLLL
jgi:hypothetical protein